MSMKRQLHINLFIQSRGHHEASWRHPDASPYALSDIAYYRDVAQRAEAGLFDSIFLADTLALMDTVGHAASNWLEPITALGALAMTTERIGLIATASTTYTEPFNLARQFASLDHITGGRVGWNIVTSWLAPAARNFGGTSLVSGVGLACGWFLAVRVFAISTMDSWVWVPWALVGSGFCLVAFFLFRNKR
jgi:hypothetical protein